MSSIDNKQDQWYNELIIIYHKIRKPHFYKVFLTLIYFCIMALYYYYSKLNNYQEMTELENCYLNCELNPNALSVSFTQYVNVTNYDKSTCSLSATKRGKGQKVVAYSYFGENILHDRGYFKGIDSNAELLMKLYPGWIMRVYHDIREKYDSIALCKLQCKYKDIMDTCFVGNIPVYGNIINSGPHLWRFLALADPLVDIMISRDLDSFLSEREVAAVNEWLLKYPNMSIHVMRDHPNGHGVAIMAGMWGAKIKSNRTFWKRMSERMLYEDRNHSGGPVLDQVFLREIVWATVTSNKIIDILAHDSYYCTTKGFQAGIILGFPTKRLNGSYNFIGSRYGKDIKPITNACPIECRRNKTWETC